MKFSLFQYLILLIFVPIFFFILLMPNNLKALNNMHSELSSVSLTLLNQMNNRCVQAAQLYPAKRYQEIVNMNLPIWATSPDTYIKLSTCRQTVEYLTASLTILNMFPEQEAVQRKEINLFPSRMDYPQFIAWIGLGDIAYHNHDWLEAGKDFSAANTMALAISTSKNNIQRSNIWNRMVTLVERYSKSKPLTEFIIEIQTALPSFEYKQGLWIQIGLAYEHLNRFPEALAAYQNALQEEPNDPFLQEYIQKIAK